MTISDAPAGESTPSERVVDKAAAMVRTSRTEILVLAGTLVLVLLFLVHGLHRCRELGLTEDESRNAVTGLYFADLLTDHPLAHPVEYTYRYYAQYPALGVTHWPPFFHVCEGIMFLVAGRSVETARFTTLIFLLVGLLFWFKLVKAFSNLWTAAFATIALGLLPSVFLFEQSVMLEVPSLALCLVATYLWVRFLDTGSDRYLYSCAVVVSLSLLTKEHSIYLLPFFAVILVAERKWRLLLRWSTIKALLLVAVLVVPYYAISTKVQSSSMVLHVVQTRRYNWRDLAFYWLALPRLLGWPMLAISILGLTAAFERQRWRQTRFMLLWVFTCYLTFTFIRAREDRYIFYWLPAFVYFASLPFSLHRANRIFRIMAAGACMVVLGIYGWNAWHSTDYPYLSGYSEMAQAVVARGYDYPVVLYDAPNNGNFIFYMRAYDHGRHFIVLRKGLYVRRLIKYFGNKELLHTPDDIRRLLAQYGIKQVVVSDDPNAIEYSAQRALREVLRGPQFRLVRIIPAIFGRDELRTTHLLLYENLQATQPSARNLRIPMMTLDKDIVVSLDESLDELKN